MKQRLTAFLLAFFFCLPAFAQTTRPAMQIVFGAYLRGDQRALMNANKPYIPLNSPLEVDIFAQNDQDADAVAKYAAYLRVSGQSGQGGKVWYIANKAEPLSPFTRPMIVSYVQANLLHIGRIRDLEPDVRIGSYNEPRPPEHFNNDPLLWNDVLPLWRSLDVLHFPNYIGPGEGDTVEKFRKTFTERAIKGKKWLDTVDGMRIFRGRTKMISFNLQKWAGDPNRPELYEPEKIAIAIDVSEDLGFDAFEFYGYASHEPAWDDDKLWYRKVIAKMAHRNKRNRE